MDNKHSGGSRGGGSGGSLEHPPCTQPPIFKYPMKIKLFGLSETKLFHFHGIFKKNKIKSAKLTPHTFMHMNPLSRNPGSAPETSFNTQAHLESKDQVG